MLYSRVNIQAESKKEERKQDSLLLPSKRAKRQSFLVLYVGTELKKKKKKGCICGDSMGKMRSFLSGF